MAKMKTIMMTEQDLQLLIGILKILADDIDGHSCPELAVPLKAIIQHLHPQDVTPLQA